MAASPWKDNAFQLGVCLVVMAVLCAGFAFFSQPQRSELVSISGRIERIQRNPGARYGAAKLILFVRTPSKVVQVNAKPWVDPDGTLAPGQFVTALVAYEDALGRDIAFLYELARGSDVLLGYGDKVAGERVKNRFIAGLSPFFAVAGVLLCALRWRRLT